VPQRVLEGHIEDVNGFDITRDGRRLASVSSDGGILVWSLPDGERLLALHVDGPLSSCCWVGSERLVAVGARGVYLFDVRG
jgi:WD40 repeat protein